MSKTLLGISAHGDPMAELVFAAWVDCIPTAENLNGLDRSEIMKRYRKMVQVPTEDRHHAVDFKSNATCDEFREVFVKTAGGVAIEEEEDRFMDHAKECSKCWMALFGVIIMCT